MHFLILLFFTLTPELSAPSYVPDNCGAINITYELNPQADQTDRIELIVAGGTKPYYFIFFDKNNNPLNWDFSNSYFIVKDKKYPKYAKVRDGEGCVKVIEFNESLKR